MAARSPPSRSSNVTQRTANEPVERRRTSGSRSPLRRGPLRVAGVGCALGALMLILSLAPVGIMQPTAYAADPATIDMAANVTAGAAPLDVTFTASTVDQPTSWAWDFGDGSSSTEASPSHTYTTPGTYAVGLTAWFADEHSETITKPDYINVGPAVTIDAPVAAFAISTSVHIAGRAISFSDRSTRSPTSWAWSFGDGGSSSSTSPSHTYAKGGRFNVTLTVRNEGGSSTATSQVTVLASWTGGTNVYRSGVFSTQATMTWCVPASVQMMVNIARNRSVHSSSEQRRFYSIGRSGNRYRYAYPGIDPQGEVAILRSTGLSGYRTSAPGSFTSALKTAAQRLRLTGKPVGLFVGAGTHAWVLTGFRATADPAVTSTFSVTAVYVMGPLWPKVQAHYGYFDLAPNTRLSTASFRRVFTPYHDKIRTIWDGRFVIVVP